MLKLFFLLSRYSFTESLVALSRWKNHPKPCSLLLQPGSDFPIRVLRIVTPEEELRIVAYAQIDEDETLAKQTFDGVLRSYFVGEYPVRLLEHGITAMADDYRLGEIIPHTAIYRLLPGTIAYSAVKNQLHNEWEVDCYICPKSVATTTKMLSHLLTA